MRRILTYSILAVASLCAGVVSAQSTEEVRLVKEIKGQITSDEKIELSRLFKLIADLAQVPNDITLGKVVSATSVNFNEPVCFRQDTGANWCSHDNPKWEVSTFSVTGLRTVSKEKESDMGADLRIRIAKKYACVPTRAVDIFWAVKPINGVALPPDSFGNDNRSLDLIRTTLYQGINQTAPHVFVETRSIKGCIVEVTLSSIRPQ